MKVSRNDPFDLELSVRGLGVILTFLHSDLYEYMFYLTFKRSMKSHQKEFFDPWSTQIDDLDFFLETGDPFVINLHSATLKVIQAKQELSRRWGIDEEQELYDFVIVDQSMRYRPYLLLIKTSKSYKKLTAYYERTLSESISCLYNYACAFTAESYKIPLILKKQFKLKAPESLRLLNVDDHTVALLKDLIAGLSIDLEELRALRLKNYRVSNPQILGSHK